MRTRVLILGAFIFSLGITLWIFIYYYTEIESKKVDLLMRAALLSGMHAAESYGPWQSVTNGNTGAQSLQLYIENVGTQEVAEKQSLWFIYTSTGNLPILRVTEFDFSRVPGSNGFATVQMGAQVQWIGPLSLSQNSYIYVNLDTMRTPAKSATQSGKY